VVIDCDATRNCNVVDLRSCGSCSYNRNEKAMTEKIADGICPDCDSKDEFMLISHDNNGLIVLCGGCLSGFKVHKNSCERLVAESC
jgi:Zn ribbon nucleic-acid-binding protein